MYFYDVRTNLLQLIWIALIIQVRIPEASPFKIYKVSEISDSHLSHKAVRRAVAEIIETANIMASNQLMKPINLGFQVGISTDEVSHIP